jgi:hypothetical protein
MMSTWMMTNCQNKPILAIGHLKEFDVFEFNHLITKLCRKEMQLKGLRIQF